MADEEENRFVDAGAPRHIVLSPDERKAKCGDLDDKKDDKNEK